MVKLDCSKVDFIFRTNLMIYQKDRAAAKKATRATLRHNLILDGLWLPRRVEHGQRLKEA
jgi:hypothetical protein